MSDTFNALQNQSYYQVLALLMAFTHLMTQDEAIKFSTLIYSYAESLSFRDEYQLRLEAANFFDAHNIQL